MVSKSELRRRIKIEKRKIASERKEKLSREEKRQLSTELFKLKQRKIIAAGKKAKGILKRGGNLVLKTGERLAPTVKKQAKLIKQQQLRDEAIERKLKKGKQKRKKTSSNPFGFQPLDF